MHKISKRWLKAMLWASSFVSPFLFALVGGYVWIKSDDEEISREVKHVFFDVMIFVAIDLVVSLCEIVFECVNALAPKYGFAALDTAVFTWIKYLAKLAKMIICGIGIVRAVLSTEKKTNVEVLDGKIEPDEQSAGGQETENGAAEQ